MIPAGWERKGGTAIATIAGTHTIAKVMIGGVWQYEVWRKRSTGWRQERVRLPSLDAALEIVQGMLTKADARNGRQLEEVEC